MLVIDDIFDNFTLPKITSSKKKSSTIIHKIQIVDPLTLQVIRGNPAIKTAGKFKKIIQVQTEADKARLQKLWLKRQMQLLKKIQDNDNLKLDKKRLNAMKKVM